MYKVLLFAMVVLFGIWAEYEEMTKMDESPEKEAESSAIAAPGVDESARGKSKVGASESHMEKTASKEDDAKEKLIKAIFQVFLLRGMRRKLVTPGTPSDAILIAVSMMFMIGLLCVVWFLTIFAILTALGPVWDRITSFRQDRTESRQRDIELDEFRTAYVEYHKENPSVIVRRGRQQSSR